MEPSVQTLQPDTTPPTPDPVGRLMAILKHDRDIATMNVTAAEAVAKCQPFLRQVMGEMDLLRRCLHEFPEFRSAFEEHYHLEQPVRPTASGPTFRLMQHEASFIAAIMMILHH